MSYNERHIDWDRMLDPPDQPDPPDLCICGRDIYTKDEDGEYTGTLIHPELDYHCSPECLAQTQESTRMDSEADAEALRECHHLEVDFDIAEKFKREISIHVTCCKCGASGSTVLESGDFLFDNEDYTPKEG